MSAAKRNRSGGSRELAVPRHKLAVGSRVDLRLWPLRYAASTVLSGLARLLHRRLVALGLGDEHGRQLVVGGTSMHEDEIDPLNLSRTEVAWLLWPRGRVQT